MSQTHHIIHKANSSYTGHSGQIQLSTSGPQKIRHYILYWIRQQQQQIDNELPTFIMTGARVVNTASGFTFRSALNVNMTPSKHVLIVDDEADICLLLSGLLRRLGYQPTCAHLLEEGRQCLSRQKFDAIFLDLNLPDGIGFDLLPVIKSDRSLIDKVGGPKVVMISAFDGLAERKRATDQGADYFMGKPFTRKTVEQALESIQV